MGDTIHRSLPRGGPPEKALTLWASLRVVLQGEASRKANVGYSGFSDLYQASLPLVRRSQLRSGDLRPRNAGPLAQSPGWDSHLRAQDGTHVCTS